MIGRLLPIYQIPFFLKDRNAYHEVSGQVHKEVVSEITCHYPSSARLLPKRELCQTPFKFLLQTISLVSLLVTTRVWKSGNDPYSFKFEKVARCHRKMVLSSDREQSHRVIFTSRVARGDLNHANSHTPPSRVHNLQIAL
jgi:hypothetical protein